MHSHGPYGFLLTRSVWCAKWKHFGSPKGCEWCQLMFDYFINHSVKPTNLWPKQMVEKCIFVKAGAWRRKHSGFVMLCAWTRKEVQSSDVGCYQWEYSSKCLDKWMHFQEPFPSKLDVICLKHSPMAMIQVLKVTSANVVIIMCTQWTYMYLFVGTIV